jgi:hypothetical protein
MGRERCATPRHSDTVSDENNGTRAPDSTLAVQTVGPVTFPTPTTHRAASTTGRAATMTARWPPSITIKPMQLTGATSTTPMSGTLG